MITIFIPIRKGSKRVKNKNLKSLPKYKFGLVEIKIKQIIELKKLIKKKNLRHNFEYVVSTNCNKTIRFLKKFKWINIHKRSNRDSTDDSLDRLIKIVPKICNGDYVLWTHVTSPYFNHFDYLNFINFFLKNDKYKSAFSADILQKFLYTKKKGWISHNIKKKKWPRTQDLEKIYIINSAAFISSKETYKKNKDRLDNNPLPIISRRASGFDIDTFEDFMKLKKELKSS